jgi:hypothetical protein
MSFSNHEKKPSEVNNSRASRRKVELSKGAMEARRTIEDRSVLKEIEASFTLSEDPKQDPVIRLYRDK